MKLRKVVITSLMGLCVLGAWGCDSKGKENGNDTYSSKKIDISSPDIYYDFSQIDGNTVKDNSGNHDGILENDATIVEDSERGGVLYLAGGNSKTEGQYLKLPAGCMDGVKELTVALDIKYEGTEVKDYVFGVGSSNAKFFSIGIGENRIDAYLQPLNNVKDKMVTKKYATSPGETWKHIVATIYADGEQYKLALYIDGEFISEMDLGEHNLASIGEGAEVSIGKPYMSGKYLTAYISEVKVYKGAAAKEDAASLYYSNFIDTYAAVFEEKLVTEMLSENMDISEIVSDIALPKKIDNYEIEWILQEGQDIIDTAGKIKTDLANDESVKVTAMYMGQTKEYELIVLGKNNIGKAFGNMVKNKLVIYNADNIRGNITLTDTVSVVEDVVDITWKSSDSNIVSDKDKGSMPKGVVARGKKDQIVTLTADYEVKGVKGTVEIPLTVKAKSDDKVYTNYIYTYFRGNIYGDGESQHIHMAASEDGLHWSALNNNEAILKAKLGTKGVRDSFIIRSPEGDRFYLIGTDLDASGGDWAAYGNKGSKYIRIWESDDLLNWSEERLVEIAPQRAGMMWAPECYYDDATGEYLVYWSTGIVGGNGKKIYCAKTRDFYTFTEAQIYKDVDSEGTYIDTTMTMYQGIYYRFTKRENDITILLETSDEILGDFKLVKDTINGESGVEGPAIFKLNGEEKWILMMDGYTGANSGVGYFPLVANSLADLKKGNFERLTSTDYEMPKGAKHGSFLPITAEEYEALIEKWGN